MTGKEVPAGEGGGPVPGSRDGEELLHGGRGEGDPCRVARMGRNYLRGRSEWDPQVSRKDAGLGEKGK
jgi:hypothetical protein